MYFANIVCERMQINLSIALIQTFGRKFKCKLCEECFATFSRTNDKITAFLPLSIRNDDTFENTLFHEQGIFSSFFSRSVHKWYCWISYKFRSGQDSATFQNIRYRTFPSNLEMNFNTQNLIFEALRLFQFEILLSK